jgi:translation initiation factor 2B subunit (eIF-2B alpha/beta/delta family)
MSDHSQISTNWSATQMEYMIILADPLEARTDEEIASYLKVDRKTLWNWRQTDGFCDEAYEILKKNISGKLGKVFAGLIKRAERGDSSAARLILEAINKLKVQGTKEGDKVINISITPKDEEAYAKQLLEGLGYKITKE